MLFSTVDRASRLPWHGWRTGTTSAFSRAGPRTRSKMRAARWNIRNRALEVDPDCSQALAVSGLVHVLF